jgi:hypothetical protein
MGDISDLDELFLDAVDHIVLEALTAIGNHPRVRLAFFRRLLAVAQEGAEKPAKRGGTSTSLSCLM